MTAPPSNAIEIPRLLLVDPELLADPFTVYGRARDQSPLVRLLAPGIRPIWGLTRLEDCRAMFSDPRFEFTDRSLIRPDIPEAALPYLRAMHLDSGGHRRLRQLMAPGFKARRASSFRPEVARIVAGLLDDLERKGAGGPVDFLADFAVPLPSDVAGAYLGLPASQRLRWRDYAEAVGSGVDQRFAEAMPGIIADTRDAIAEKRSQPGDDVISRLVRVQAESAAKGEPALSDMELEALIWISMMASSAFSHFMVNGLHALLTHPEQLAWLRADPRRRMAGAVEELIRWASLTLISIPREASEDIELFGVIIQKGDPMVAVLAAANRDPRLFSDPERLDLQRHIEPPGHLAFGHGPHVCAGNFLARVMTEEALIALLLRFPDLALAVPPEELRRVPDPGTWRLESLPLRLGDPAPVAG